MNFFFRGVYILALGFFLTLLVVYGISAFYEAPKQTWPPQTSPEAFQQATNIYARNKFLIGYSASLLFIVLGTVVRPRLDVLKPGLILGGIGAMIYALPQKGLADEWRFVGIAVILAVLVFLGYRFLRERPSN